MVRSRFRSSADRRQESGAQNLQIRLAPDLQKRVQRSRRRQETRPSLSETVRCLIGPGLGVLEEEIGDDFLTIPRFD